MLQNISRALRARKEDGEKGFTLIELLVVVLIIGILAAIAIPVFIGQQNGAKDAAAKSDLANSKTAVVAYAAANNGVYPGASGTVSSAELTALGSYGFIGSVSFVTSGTNFCLTESGASAWSIGASSSGAVNNATCS